MRIVAGRVCLLLLLLLLTAGCTRSRPRADGAPLEPEKQIAVDADFSRVQWLNYYDALSEPSRETNRTMILYFTKKSCPGCTRMDKWTFTDERVLKAIKGFMPIKIRGDADLQIVRRFAIQTFPMIVFAEADGGEIDRKAGYRSADSMIRWVEDVKAGKATLRALNTQLKHEPNNLQALLRQARNYLDADEVEQAIELTRKASDRAAENADVLAMFGLCYMAVNRLEEADAAVAAALKADPGHDEARNLKTAILLKRADESLAEGDSAKAADIFAAILSEVPENFDACMGLGRMHAASGEYDRAMEAFQKATTLRPDSPVPRAASGNVHMQTEEYAKAEQDLLEAIEIEPRYEPPYFYLMELYEKTGRRDALLRTYEKVLPLEPAGAHNEIAWFMAVSKHSEIFDPASAAKHAGIAVELEPHPWYIDTLAEAYYAGGKYNLAIALIKEAIAKHPGNLQYYEDQLEKFRKAREQAFPRESGSGDER